VPTAQPVRPDDVSKFNKATERGTESGITVQPPISGTQPVISERAAPDEHGRNVTRRRSGLLAGGGYENDDDADAGYSPQFAHHAAPSGPPSPLPKIIGGVAMLMFLVKAFSFVTGFMASDWKQFSWLMMDQVTMIVMFLCVAILAFTRKD
jgi:hypothetical protein